MGGGGGGGGWWDRKNGTTQQTVAMPGRKARWHPRDTAAMLDENSDNTITFLFAEFG